MNNASPHPSSSTWFVVCLCAQWCRVCRQYQQDFEALQRQQFPDWRFVWLDVEEHEDVLGELDVETFPTLLVAQAEQAHFMGALPPQAAVLQRLLQSLPAQAAAGVPLGGNEPLAALWQAVYNHILTMDMGESL